MRAIKSLQQALERVGAKNEPRLWKSLWGAVVALVVGGDLRPASLGRHCRRPTSHKHRIKAIDRLIGNPRMVAALRAVYQGLAKLLLSGMRDVVVVVDWTQVDARHDALVAAVPVGGRALPILCHVHAHARIPTRAMHRAFLDELAMVLPSACRPTLITDAGFQGTWMIDVARRGWRYIGRLRHRTCVRSNPDSEWVPNKTLHGQATTKPKDLGAWQVGKDKSRYPTRLVLAQQPRRGRKRLGRRGKPLRGGCTVCLTKRHQEPWLLAVNVDCPPSAVIDLYKTRMQIEETFRDAKSSRFGWSLSLVRCHQPERLRVLLLIAVLALTAVTLVGLAAEQCGAHRQLQANSVRHRPVLSRFHIGCLVLTTPTTYRFKPAGLMAAIRQLRRLICGDP